MEKENDLVYRILHSKQGRHDSSANWIVLHPRKQGHETSLRLNNVVLMWLSSMEQDG